MKRGLLCGLSWLLAMLMVSVPVSAAEEPVTISCWLGVFNQMPLAQDEWYITGALERFEAANPDIKVDFSPTPSGLDAYQMFKAAAAAQSGPDVVGLWPGQYIFSLKEALLPLNDYISEGEYNSFTKATWDVLTQDGTIYGYPITGNTSSFFFYNKRVMDSLGLDLEADPPKTRQAFDQLLQTIKDSGITPIASDEGAWPALFTSIGVNWWHQRHGYDRMYQNVAGETRFQDDEDFLDTLHYYQSLYTNGYVNQDTLSSVSCIEDFMSGRAAMTPDGSWSVKKFRETLGDDLRVLIPPTIDEGAEHPDTMISSLGDCVVVAGYTQQADACMKLLQFLNSKEEALRIHAVIPNTPARSDLTPADLGWEGDPVMEKIFHYGVEKESILWLDSTLNKDVYSELVQYLPMVITGKMTPEELAARLDDVVMEIS